MTVLVDTSVWSLAELRKVYEKDALGIDLTVFVEDQFGPREGLHRQLIDAVQKAVRAALREHKLMGNPIAIWRNGRVVLVPPDQIDA